MAYRTKSPSRKRERSHPFFGFGESSKAKAADAGWLGDYEGDVAGKSVFLRDEDTVCHVYSAYACGTELLGTHYNYLDLTPYGRQEDWEDSPEGWPQKPTYG